MNSLKNAAGYAALAVLVAGCATTSGTSDKVTYDNTIRQLVETRCYTCHGPQAPSMVEFKKDDVGFKAKSLGPRMDSYENLLVMVNGTDTGAIMRRLDDGTNTNDKKPGNMYEQLGADDAERAANLARFKRWVGSWNLKKNKDISDEERKAVLAPRS